MNQPRQRHSQDKRQCLMEAALLVFAEKGFDAAGLREIAQRSEVNPAMIAYYFGSKDGLYETSLKWIASDFFQKLQNLQNIPDPNAPHVRETILSNIEKHLKELFAGLMGNQKSNGAYSSLLWAAHKLWSQEMENPRSSLVDFIVEQFRASSECFNACIKILKPEISNLEIDAMLISIRGSIFFFYKHLDIIQKTRGAPYTDDELDKLNQHFADFSLRVLGIPGVLSNEGA